MMNMIGSIPQQKFHFQLLLYHDKFYEKELLSMMLEKVIEIVIDQTCALC